LPILGRLRTTGIDQDFLNDAAKCEYGRDSNYALYDDYYSGHNFSKANGSRLTDRAKKYLERSGLVFTENFCEPLIDVFAERLTVTGFTAEDKDAQQDSTSEESALTERLTDLEDWLGSVWAKNRMDDKQGIVHTQTLLKGDAYLIVDWDEERALPRLSFNRAESIPHCVYDEENADHVAWASKTWNTDTVSASNLDGRAIQRLNVYYPDRVERYFRLGREGSGSWERFLGVQGDEWPMPWVRGDGSPRGVPVFHFRHKPLGSDYGRSELHGSIPLQDELNKMVIDLSEVLDYQGWPQRYGTGIDSSTANHKPQPGAMMWHGDKEATFGQFDPADPAGPLAAIEGVLSRMARRSRTPMHLLTGGTTPSGEALKTAESGLVSKVKQAQVPLGNVWEDVMLMAVKLGVDAGELEVAVDEENLVLQAEWENPETRNEESEARTAEILRGLGISLHSIHAHLGYSYEEEQEWKAKEAETLNEAAGNLLNAGAGLGGATVEPGPEPERNGQGAMRSGYVPGA
jgi:hypothetical protein